jgi:gas vesicle protein
MAEDRGLRPPRPAPAARASTPASGRPSVTFLAGLGIGLALGAAAGILLAPRSGADTRRALRNRGRKVGNRARDVWDDLRLELEATRRALRRKRRDAKVEIEEEKLEGQ